MEIDRRTFLAATAVSSALAGQQAAGPAPIVVVPAAGRSEPDIGSVFDELGLRFESVRGADLERVEPGGRDLLWIVSPDYPEPSPAPAVVLRKIGEFLSAGKGVFAEFITNFPGLPLSDEMHKSGIARLFVSSALPVPRALPAGAILEEHDSMYLPALGETAGAEIILKFGKVPGVRMVVPGGEPAAAWPGLFLGKRESGRFALATTSLSDFRRRQYAPVAHWELFLSQLVLSLLPESKRAAVLAAYIPLRLHTEPRVWVQPGERITVIAESAPGLRLSLVGQPNPAMTEGPEGQYRAEWKPARGVPARIQVHAARGARVRTANCDLRIADRRVAYKRALERNIRWFERSGVLLKSDGSAGVAEWISGPDIEGRRIAFGAEQLFSPERADCVFQSALAFWMYGQAAGSPRHQAVGRNMLHRIMDFQRLEPGDAGYGLWYSRGRGGPAFQDDTSWATICALAGYRYTRQSAFLHRGLISAKAQLKAFGPDGATRVPVIANSGRNPRMTAQADSHPHNGGCVLSAWLYAYGMTGDRTYLDTAVPMLTGMITAFPSIPRYIISRTCESARFLLPLALACAYTRDERFTHALEDRAAYLRSRMDPCGAIQEEGSNIEGRVEGGDLGLTYDRNETISDQLYCTGFAAMNFWIAYKATGDKRYLSDFLRVADYLVRIQIESPDPAIDGGWMRGFDYQLWEYYGANADMAWTAFSMETGWQNAIIDIALALYLMDDPFFETRKPAAA